jgi:class 3 adenylate cyclase
MQDRSRYLVLAADVVSSTRLVEAKRGELQVELTNLLSELNTRYAQQLRTRLLMVAGDSFQAVIGDPRVIPHIAWHIWLAFADVDLRLGVGFGRIFTQFNEDSRLMDGPAFHNAAKFGVKEQGIFFRGFGDPEDAVLNGLGALLNAAFQNFSARQREVLPLLRTGIPQLEIAHKLGISKQAVSRLVRTSGWHGYKQGEDGMREALMLFTTESRPESFHE